MDQEYFKLKMGQKEVGGGGGVEEGEGEAVSASLTRRSDFYSLCG
jgi:hypothetical protein